MPVARGHPPPAFRCFQTSFLGGVFVCRFLLLYFQPRLRGVAAQSLKLLAAAALTCASAPSASPRPFSMRPAHLGNSFSKRRRFSSTIASLRLPPRRSFGGQQAQRRLQCAKHTKNTLHSPTREKQRPLLRKRRIVGVFPLQDNCLVLVPFSKPTFVLRVPRGRKNLNPPNGRLHFQNAALSLSNHCSIE